MLDFCPYPENEGGSLRLATGECFGCDLWSDAIVSRGAEVVASYEVGPLAGEPAVIRHHHGQGEVFYVGTRLDEVGMSWLLDLAAARAGIGVSQALPSGVESVRRVAKDDSFLFLLNHNDETVDVKLEVPGVELLSGQPTNSVHLLPRGVAVVREDKVAG